MALNGSNFGASSSLEDFNEKQPYEYDDSVHHLPVNSLPSAQGHLADAEDGYGGMIDEGYNAGYNGQRVGSSEGYYDENCSVPPMVQHNAGGDRDGYPTLY